MSCVMLVSKFLDPKNDMAFKRIFGTEKNKDILIHFLNDIFARQTDPIEDVTFLKTAQDPEIASQRVSIVDIMCQDSKNNRFIVEIQVVHEPGFVKRAQYYAAKAYIDQRGKGSEYKDLKQVTFLAITDFVLFSEKEDYLSHHHILDTCTLERDLKDFSFSFLELPKFKKEKDHLKTMTEKWAFFFKNADETQEQDLDDIIGSDLIVKRAYEELNRFAWSTEELRAYDSIDMKQAADKAILEGAFDLGKAEGIEEGMEKGMEKGRAEAAREIAKAMLAQGIPLETIKDVTGLALNEIKSLR
ncbi:Rpn family recombination-promoting nuclease/putative transposase [Microcystis sp. M169S2]|uniref:Rpn family recombination-promoting nuclease/putative transposase n=1 Tax=Microcystis sp. M169S2 TaxID=2771157 RepID=UPI00258CFA5A|nr:Rpn family recombination-promoting nuclease/putative transposase [Microcystis sp. M169S2]